MKKMKIKLDKISDAKSLVDNATKVNGDVWLSNESGYRVSGKSILGVFDVAQDSAMCVEYPESAEDFDEFLQKLELKSATMY